MSERKSPHSTADLALGVDRPPRIDAEFLVSDDSYIDLLLLTNSNDKMRLRVHDINDRWLRITEIGSADSGYVPDDWSERGLPTAAYDTFELGQEFAVGRGDNNPDGLPSLESRVISRDHFRLRVSMGERGLILAINDHASYNGTELVVNDSVVALERELV